MKTTVTYADNTAVRDYDAVVYTDLAYADNYVPSPSDLTNYSINNTQTAYERHIYCLSPTPPRLGSLQDYIDRYLDEGYEIYFEWFMHFMEPRINAKADKYVRRFNLDDHFTGLKSACVCGIWEALTKYRTRREVPFIEFMQRIVSAHMIEYVREMRPGFSIPKASTFRMERNIMAAFNALGGTLDGATIAETAKQCGMSVETAERHIRLCMRAQNVVSFEDLESLGVSEDTENKLVTDSSPSPEQAYFSQLRADEVMSAYEQLEYRERDIVAGRLDFCMECYSVTQCDNRGFDRNGSKKPTFEELANSYGLRSADAAEDIFRKALGKMRDKL